jgi:general L-amino acid transport system permease protein
MNNRRDAVSVQRPKGSLLNDKDFRAVLFQILILAGVIAVGWYLVHNTLANLEQRKIAVGFSFLGRESGFGIGESLIPSSAADTYARAIVVGILNTLMVAVIGIVLSTILGTIIGIARLSSNWLVAKLASVYVETLRNIPLLLQLFFWYTLIGEALPNVGSAIEIIPGAVFLSQKGLRVPHIIDHPIHTWMWLLFFVGIVATFFWRRAAAKHQAATGQIRPVFWPSLGFIFGLPLLLWAVVGAPLQWDLPKLGGFNFSGGGSVSPELISLAFGLVLYTAAFIAENVRAGILAVPKGQWEAAGALGVTRGTILRLIVLPQALRVIIPPITSQYLNLTKNSSLAVAIGYPDLVSILNTTMNQTGQAVEGVSLIMAAYLTVSLSISAFMNWYNKRIALIER